ncbi:cilia- and flagella-associated protein 251 [Orussus abietinus]|uniref:cilia- and flagella-associated protein 251 n=1 Tax=Orussus abietinus TaxID=222816 RepID=UPI000C715F9B|nr:cilia- and flagella-associated protein 251 [Orussus abietinus]
MSTPSSTNSDVSDDEGKKKKQFQEGHGNTCPFKLEWSFGINPNVPVINLTTDKRTLIAYACNHVGILYDYVNKDVIPLQGHKNDVATLSVSKDGKWLLSADFENDCVVVVWDTETRIPICTLFDPHGGCELSAVRISPDAKYIVTVGNEPCQIVKIWLWTYGKDIPNGAVTITDMLQDRIKNISFNHDSSNEFILTSDSHVLFVAWEHNAFHVQKPTVVGRLQKFGVFNNSVYVSKTHEAFTGTAAGFLLIWSDTDNVSSSTIDPTSSVMKHVKSVQLQDCSITLIITHEDMIVTGNSFGHINFYDHQLKYLHSCRNCEFDSISSISFDCPSKLTRPYQHNGESDRSSSVHEKDINEGNECEGDLKTVEKFPGEEGENEDKEEEIVKTVSSNLTIDIHCSHTIDNNEATQTGQVAWIEFTKGKCHFIMHTSEVPIIAMDIQTERDYLVTGNTMGLLRLYNYSIPSLFLSKKTPPLPSFQSILNREVIKGEIVYITQTKMSENLTCITALKFSPRDEMLACGLENGVLWTLHPDTLEPLDDTPYRHSPGAILKIAFSLNSEFMAYSDDTSAVAVFRRNKSAFSLANNENTPIWYYVGKYHSHFMPIREILFVPPPAGLTTPRLLSLGEDRDLVEYDLENSGPYPDPGLKILQVTRIERDAVPLCMAPYPQLMVERFLIVANSKYKFKLLNEVTKMNRRTVRCPTFSSPVQHIKMLPVKGMDSHAHMIFATEKELAIRLVPSYGNPFMNVAIIGHPRKLKILCVSSCGKKLFTLGYNDHSVFMWKINLRSVDIMARLGGSGLSPYYCLLEGGSNGWLVQELQDLFYYAQILQQGENTMTTRIVTDKVSVKQLPNLMRAIGFYPSNYELEDMMNEVIYKNYAETGQRVDEISFEELIKLYINHRPAFGISSYEMKKAFSAFDDSAGSQNPKMSLEAFIDVLLGRSGPHTYLPSEENKLYGSSYIVTNSYSGLERFDSKRKKAPDSVTRQNERVSHSDVFGSKLYEPIFNKTGEPLTVSEAHTCLTLLMSQGDIRSIAAASDQDFLDVQFNFLPTTISYKDFAMDIMGIELPEGKRQVQLSENSNP